MNLAQFFTVIKMPDAAVGHFRLVQQCRAFDLRIISVRRARAEEVEIYEG